MLLQTVCWQANPGRAIFFPTGISANTLLICPAALLNFTHLFYMATRKLKTISIKGKEYVEVKERILYLANQDDFDYSIQTDYQYFESRKMWVVKAKLTIYKDEKEYVYTGLAQELESDNYREVNYSSALENAETSAVGRACAMAGIGVIDSIASADEISKSQNRQPATAAAEATPAPAAVEDNRPWLSDKQLEAVVNRIKAGDKEVYQKTLDAFKVNKKHREELSQAMKTEV
jgi:hypothetical protein